MYERVAVSIEETMSLDQGERSPDRQGLLFSQPRWLAGIAGFLA